MVVGSATVKPGEVGTVNVSVIMHEGMGGPHLFHLFVKSSDPEKRETLLKVQADIVSLETWKRAYPRAFYLPRELANFPLRMESVGSDAMTYVRMALGPDGQIKNAYLGRYEKNKKEVRVLVSEHSDAEKTTTLFSAMLAKMATKPGALNHHRKMDVGGYTVYASKNTSHEYFYFQGGNKVVWLFPDSSVAKQSVEEMMKHMQIQGS